MALDGSCYFSSCASKIKEKHQGICPDGWHIPSNADWDKLFLYVDNDTYGNGFVEEDVYISSTAGKYLKATYGWNEEGNGVDKYGFSALPGVGGYDGFWWKFYDKIIT